LIIFFDISPAEATAQVAQARSAGIPVFALDGQPAPGVRVNGWIDNNNYAQGKTLADYLSSKLPKGSEVTVIAAIAGAPVTDQEIDGALAGFKANGMKFVGNVNQQRNNIDNAAGGQAVMRAILAKYPGVRGVLSYNDDSVAGAGWEFQSGTPHP